MIFLSHFYISSIRETLSNVNSSFALR
jgi:hypothetical protein